MRQNSLLDHLYVVVQNQPFSTVGRMPLSLEEDLYPADRERVIVAALRTLRLRTAALRAAQTTCQGRSLDEAFHERLQRAERGDLNELGAYRLLEGIDGFLGFSPNDSLPFLEELLARWNATPSV